MPGMDGTGPMGFGPRTGGGRGWCNPYFAGFWFAGSASSLLSRPYGRAYPYGVGVGYAPYPPYGALSAASYIPFGWGRGMGRGGGRGIGGGRGGGWW